MATTNALSSSNMEKFIHHSGNSSIIRAMAKYIWWKPTQQALENPERIVAQVMNIGDYDDVCAVAHEIGEDGFKEVLQQAEPGQFDHRSWHYWHYRLGLAKCEEVPPLPSRTFSS